MLLGVSGCLSLLLTGVVRAFALRYELLDHPNNRSSHSTPTPRGGGIAIVIASVAGITLGVAFGAVKSSEALGLGSGMILVAIVGWVDDVRGLPPRVRLALHTCIGFSTVWLLHGLPSLLIGNVSLTLGIIGYLLGTLGIVWSINLFNFMDGIDGLAGSQAVLIFGAVAVLLIYRGNVSLATIAAIMAACSAGFLAWNWPPAKIFLGDVGSGAIGYMIAGLAIASENSHSVSLVVIAIIDGVFIFDATVTLIRRFARGDRLTEAHRHHAYQRLTQALGSHRSVTGWAALVTVVLALIGAAATIDHLLLLPSLLFATLVLACLAFAVEKRAPM